MARLSTTVPLLPESPDPPEGNKPAFPHLRPSTSYHIPLQQPHPTKPCLSCLSTHDIVNAYQLIIIRILIVLSNREVWTNRAAYLISGLASIVTSYSACNKAEPALRNVSKQKLIESQLDGVNQKYAVCHQSCRLSSIVSLGQGSLIKHALIAREI